MPSYSQYKRQMAVMDADDANIETWITVKGNHIPIMKGQSKEEAVQSFLEKKGKSSGGAKKEPETGTGEHHSDEYYARIAKQKLQEKAWKSLTPDQQKKVKLMQGFKTGKISEAEFMKEAGKLEKKSGEKPVFRELKGTKHQGGTIGLSKEEHNRIEEYNKWARKVSREARSGKAAREANARPILKADENADVSDIVKQYKKDMKALGENASESKRDKVEVNAIKEFLRRKVGAGHPYEDYYNYWLRGMNDKDQEAFFTINELASDNRVKAFEALSNEKEKPANKGWQNARSGHPETVGKVVRRVVKKMGEERADSKKKVAGSSTGWPESPKFEKLTEKYMPKSGAADNELGEALRSINQAVYRYYNDGDMYNKGYGKETVNAAIKHLTQLSKNKATPRHIARGIDNGLYELKTYGLKDKGRYETALKILLQTFEFADEKDIDALSKMKRNND